MSKMTEREFGGLIVRHRKSAVFFEQVADIEKDNSYGHDEYVCITELRRVCRFTEQEFQEFYEYCVQIAGEAWKNFEPKEVDSMGADYDDYYDREFDNNGSLSIGKNSINIEGPYAQPKSNGNIVRLIKFNKRKFESFVFDLAEKVGAEA